MRVFLGTFPVAGVLWEYRKGLRSLGVDARVVISEAHPFAYPFDELFEIRGGFLQRRYGEFKHLVRFIRHFDIFHFFFGSSLKSWRARVHYDVPFLKLAGKKIVMTFLGSDIRCNTEVLKGHIRREDCDYCRYPCKLYSKLKVAKFWGRNADVIFAQPTYSQILDFFSIPYQFIVLPCDTEYWIPFESDFYRKKEGEVVIVHAPSKPLFKGTRFVLSAIKKLKSEGFNINFKLLQGMPNTVVREWLNVADIVVDQFGLGWYGKFSVESMALAKPTICYIRDEYRQQIKHGRELPLVSATPSTLYEVLASLYDDLDLREKIGQKSRKYVIHVHDSRLVCKELLEIYTKS